MAPLNVGGCSRTQTRTFCQHFKTILGHFTAFFRSGLRLPGQAEQHSGVKSNSISGTERRVSSSPSALSALLRDVLPELENAAKCSRIVLKCGQNVRVCAREQPAALSGAIWNQHLARSERVFLQRTPKTANKTLHLLNHGRSQCVIRGQRLTAGDVL